VRVKHTEFTVRNYASYALVILALGLITVGFGTIDLVMIAPKGVEHVAAVGQGELVVTAIYALFIGVVDVFASRLAMAEGEGITASRLPVLARSFLLLLVPCQLAAAVVVVGLKPLLSLFGQSQQLIPLVGTYVAVRSYGIIPVILYLVINEALKICGLKNRSIVILILGFALNAALNWVFLYTRLLNVFGAPETAVAASTVIAQLSMAVVGGWMFVRHMRTRDEALLRPGWQAVMDEFRSMYRTAAGVGVRHFNDYAGSIVPLMFIGTRGVGALAAAVVATKIYTLFCRIPQACFSCTFVFYGYALGRDRSELAATARKLRIYAGVPTAMAALAVLILSPWLVGIFASKGLDPRLAQFLLFAYILYVPAYFFEQFAGEMLTVHQRGGLLFGASTLVTYAVTIPMAWYTVFILHSTFLTIACKGLSTALLAVIFWKTVRRYIPARTDEVLSVP